MAGVIATERYATANGRHLRPKRLQRLKQVVHRPQRLTIGIGALLAHARLTFVVEHGDDGFIRVVFCQRHNAL